MRSAILTMLLFIGITASLPAQENSSGTGDASPAITSGVHDVAENRTADGAQNPAAAESPAVKEAAAVGPEALPGSGAEYRLTADGRLKRFEAEDRSWIDLNENLPVKIAYPFTPDLRDRVFSFGFDPVSPDRLAVATPRGISVSEDGGAEWAKIPVENGISPNIHFVSTAVSPFSRDTYLAGTSFDGLYETTDGGKTWTELTADANFLYHGIGFYEEIAAAAYDPGDADLVYFAAGFSDGLYRYRRSTETWEKLEFPGYAEGEDIGRLQFRLTADRNHPTERVLEVWTAAHLWEYRPADGSWHSKAYSDPDVPEIDPATRAAKTARLEKARNRDGIYLSAYQAGAERIDRHLAFMKAHGLNSLVVDFKDDFGYLRYDSKLPTAKAAGAVRPLFTASELVRKAHENGIYLIARIVVFKDQQLYEYRNYRYALKDRYSGKPWGNIFTVKDPETGEERREQREFWVDPYSEDVWKYNVGIAEELQSLGVDEVQFDYIRFPSDGPVSRINASYKKDGMTRVNALESFLHMAREALSIPIGTDVYGFNAWFRMKYIGQDVTAFAPYIDVVSPMFYPSHFPREFLGDMKYLPRANYIYRSGSDRAVSIVGPDVVIRPYVQAFLIGGELKFEKPTYTAYLIEQLKGLEKSAGSGFSLWNASGRYYMVTDGIDAFTAAGRE